ncbi:MAG TPA: putative selenium-dependent hydroxylase accessory protein YqeC, partial [Gammaproteobacteria bacterium]|nr:putative selenium-dependent hydroxylase accessory protein YqeC [Gammaproteobacteria bacterium]
PVVSAHPIGEPLSERIANRVDRLASVLNIRPGDSLTANHIAQLLASDQGMLKGVGKARVVPLINRVDSPAIKQAAWEAAEQALALSSRFDRVVLACMRYPNPLVGVVWR